MSREGRSQGTGNREQKEEEIGKKEDGEIQDQTQGQGQGQGQGQRSNSIYFPPTFKHLEPQTVKLNRGRGAGVRGQKEVGEIQDQGQRSNSICFPPTFKHLKPQTVKQNRGRGAGNREQGSGDRKKWGKFKIKVKDQIQYAFLQPSNISNLKRSNKTGVREQGTERRGKREERRWEALSVWQSNVLHLSTLF